MHWMLLTVTNVTISNHVLDRILMPEDFRAQMFPRLVDNLFPVGEDDIVQRGGLVSLSGAG